MHNKYLGKWTSVGVTFFLAIAAAICLFFFLNRIDTVTAFFDRINFILRPIYYGLILSFLLLPIHRYILKWERTLISQKSQSKRWVQSVMNGMAITLSLVFAGIMVYVVLAMLLPQLYISIVGLVNALPGYGAEIQLVLMGFLEDNPDIQGVVIHAYTAVGESLSAWLKTDLIPNLASINSTLDWLQETILPNVTGVVTNVYSVLIAAILVVKDAFIAVIVSVYLLARKDVFSAQTKKITYSVFSVRIADFLVEEVRAAYRILSGFINGKLLDSLIIGVITLVACNIFNFPYAILVATIIGITNIIPFFGPFIGAIPCAILILLVSPIQCLYFLIFILALQQFDGNILGPKILGESTGLASFWVLFSILFFGGLFGFAGMVLGVPVFAMLYSMVSRLVKFGLEKRGMPTDTVYYQGATGKIADKLSED